MTYPSSWTNLEQERKTVVGAVGEFKLGEVQASGHVNLNLTKDMRINVKENWALTYGGFTLSSLGKFLIGGSTSTDALLSYGYPKGTNAFVKVGGIGAGGIKGGAVIGAMIPASKTLKVGAEAQFGKGKRRLTYPCYRRILGPLRWLQRWS